MNARFDGVNHSFDLINQRFDDMRDLWRAELRRVEEILDARLKHLGGAARLKSSDVVQTLIVSRLVIGSAISAWTAR